MSTLPGIHIKPKKYAATFFSYIDPKTMIVDDGLTQHSGCPVFEGEKKIVTQWIRLGVDEETPWDSFDTRELYTAYTYAFSLSHCQFLTFIHTNTPSVGVKYDIAENQ